MLVFKMRKIYLLWAVLSFFAFQSCDRYLEVKVYGKAIPESAEEFAAILHNHLNNIDYGKNQVLLDNATEIMRMESVTDNFNATLTFSSGRVGLPIYLGSMINDKQQRYQQLYEVIRDANIVIDNMPKTADPEEQNVLGTAYALRAVSYLHLLREYCEPYENDEQLGLVLINHFDMEERKTRSNYGATREFIEKDFEKALTFPLDDEIYRYTKDVVKAYMAKFYFCTHRWEEAEELSEELLATHPLLSGSGYTSMILSENYQEGYVLVRKYLYKGEADTEILNAKSVIKLRALSIAFMEVFAEKEKDIRYGLSVDRKRIAQKYISGKVRTAEALLMAAESYAHLGKEEEALALINSLRDHR